MNKADQSLRQLNYKTNGVGLASIHDGLTEERKNEIALDAVCAYCQWVADEIEHGEWLLPWKRGGLSTS